MQDSTIVVTAAATDDGRGCVRDFCRRGAHVIALDGDGSALGRLSGEIEAEGGRISPFVLDLTAPAEMEQLAARIASQTEVIDGLVTCPKDWEVASIEQSSIASWRRVLNANVIGPVLAAKTFLPFLKRSPRGAVVHIGSVDGLLGNPAVPSYSASKGAIVSLTHVMADEFAAYGIRVNCIARAMAVERGDALPPGFAPLLKHTPLGRSGYHEEIAAAARFLLSRDAGYITGAVLPVDGGRTAITPGTRALV